MSLRRRSISSLLFKENELVRRSDQSIDRQHYVRKFSSWQCLRHSVLVTESFSFRLWIYEQCNLISVRNKAVISFVSPHLFRQSFAQVHQTSHFLVDFSSPHVLIGLFLSHLMRKLLFILNVECGKAMTTSKMRSEQDVYDKTMKAKGNNARTP